MRDVRGGFTLIELLVAVALFGLVAAGLAQTVIAAQQARAGSARWLHATALAEERLERLRAGDRSEDATPVRAGYTIECGSGTYVRSLIADLGDAYCLELRRTAIGPFLLSDAATLPPRGSRWSDPPLIELEHALELARRAAASKQRVARPNPAGEHAARPPQQ